MLVAHHTVFWQLIQGLCIRLERKPEHTVLTHDYGKTKADRWFRKNCQRQHDSNVY